MVSLCIFVCLAAVLFTGFSCSALGQAEAERITVAVSLAEQAMEEIKSREWNFFTPGEKELGTASLPAGYRIQAVILPTANELLREIRVTVFYGKKSVQLNSLISYYSVKAMEDEGL